ncbi:MAG: ATP-binding protein [Pseudomonadota bacterium]|nr:ATP-binding protein [Pseudomonadota bacterium]
MTGKPKKNISILLLLLPFTVLLGMITISLQHHYSSYKLDQLNDQIENNQQRIRIGSYIVEDLKEVETDFFRLLTFNNPKSRQLTVNSLKNRLAEIATLLRIIEHGGSYDRLVPLNLAEQDTMTIKIHYQPKREGKFVGELLSLKSIMSNLKKKVRMIVEQPHQDNNSLHPAVNMAFLREAESYFTRANERANKLLYDSNLELEVLHQKIEKRERYFNIIEVASSCLTIIIVMLLGGLISRKITLINLNLEKNIAALEKSRQKLQQSEEKFRTVAFFTYAWEYWLNENGVPIYISPSCGEITGYEAEDFFQNPDLFNEIIHPDDREQLISHFNHTVDRNPCQLEYRIITKENEIRWLQHSCLPVYNRAGDYAGRRGSNYEITERHQTRLALAKSTKEWETTFDSMPDPICILDLNHRIVRINRPMAKAFKLNPLQCMGQSCCKLVHNTSQPPKFCPHSQLLKDGREHSTEVFIEQLERYFLVTVSPLFDDDAKLTGSIHIARDITEQKKLARDLQESHDNLENIVAELQRTHQQLLHSEKLSAIGRISASIAHEINNPLFGVMTILGGLKKREELSNKGQNAVELALSECQRVKKLIANLQDFNRPTPGRFAPQAINQLIDEVLLLIAKEFKNQRLQIIKEYADDLPEIKIVADQIKQVLLNLLQNAAAASPPNSDITITTKQTGHQLAISIKDQGCGITAENQPHIFEPFFTTKSEVKGTGLGLSVSFGIIRSHKGEIQVKSSPGQGTTFTILLPIKKDNSKKMRSHHEQQ